MPCRCEVRHTEHTENPRGAIASIMLLCAAVCIVFFILWKTWTPAELCPMALPRGGDICRAAGYDAGGFESEADDASCKLFCVKDGTLLRVASFWKETP
jgi:hypothetical protein